MHCGVRESSSWRRSKRKHSDVLCKACSWREMRSMHMTQEHDASRRTEEALSEMAVASLINLGSD
jgi:hypothetical protein